MNRRTFVLTFLPGVAALGAAMPAAAETAPPPADRTGRPSFFVGLDTSVVVPKRGKGEVSVVLRIDKPGRYTFECHRMCGAGHNFMRGELVVRERTATGKGQ